MTRKISCLFVLTLFLMVIASGSLFAAAAKKSISGSDPRDRQPIQNLPLAGAEDVPFDASLPKSGSGENTSLGYSALANPFQVGLTYQEYQHNGRQAHQIVMGCANRVMNVWMHLPAASTANRVIQYRDYIVNAALGATSDITNIGGGYTSLDAAVNGFASPAWHRVAANGTETGMDFACGAASIAEFAFPAANCSATLTGGDAVDGVYIWPSSCVDNVGGSSVALIVASESSPGGAGAIQSMVFYKSNAGITAASATCGVFLDSIYDIAPSICQNPNNNDVAIAYTKPRAYMAEGNQYNNDVWVRTSNDNGTTWNPVAVNASSYATGDLERAYTHTDCLYTFDNCLHVVWDAPDYDSVAGTISTQACKLRHWSSCILGCKSLIINADHFAASCERGAWNRNVTKPTLSECTTAGPTRALYVVYTYFKADDDVVSTDDCSSAGNANGDIYAQVSSTGGSTWGPPTNLTNTTTNNCAGPNCSSEHWGSAAKYVTDSLRIQYIKDLDAGGIVQTEGTWQNNPVMNLNLACFGMTLFRSLSAVPSGFDYPFHTVPTQNTDTTFVLTNSGNDNASYTTSITYINGSGWLSFLGGTGTGVVPAGCTNTTTLQMRATGPATEGLFCATVIITYNDGTNVVTLEISVWIYNFSSFYLPQNAAIRTASVRLNVQQTSRTGDQEAANGMLNFADTSSYLFDGSLVIGNSANNLSWLIFEGGTGLPTGTNPFGSLYAVSDETYDSTTFGSYRKAKGTGVNRDSTICIVVDWWAPKHPDSSCFIIGQFCLYAGPKDTTATINNVTVAYAVDFDVPSDTGSDNESGFDEDRTMVWQKGAYTSPNNTRYAGLVGLDENDPAPAGFVWDNPSQVYPLGNFENDSIWNRMQNQVGYSAFSDSITDLNSVIVLDRGLTIQPRPFVFYCWVIIVYQPKLGNLAGLNQQADKGVKFMCQHGILPPNHPRCTPACTTCGDANSDGVIGIADAVFLIQFIFAGGPAPQDCNYLRGKGDANGDGVVGIADAVYLIQFIFAGGPAPHCQGM
jgi:hypothetical protein